MRFFRGAKTDFGMLRKSYLIAEVIQIESFEAFRKRAQAYGELVV